MVQRNEYLVNTMDTDGLVLWRQGMSSLNEYKPMYVYQFMVSHM